MDTTKIRSFENIKQYDKVLYAFIFSIVLYSIAAIYNDVFVNLMSVTSYLTWHTIFEFASILVSFSIFAVTYFIYDDSGSLRMMVLGIAFLATGFLDAFHTFSFKGMPDFFIVNETANRATTLWILARLFGSLGFLSAILIPANSTSKIRKEIFAAITVIVVIILFLAVTYFPDLLPAMYIEEIGLTSIKILLEYLIISIMGITFMMVVAEYNKLYSKREYMFMIALVLLIFSEFAFTNYGSVYDAFNYIGHVYKVVAYFILYNAIFVENVSVPYREMKRARKKLKEYNANLNLIVKQRTKELEEINKELLSDIEYAKEMQRCLLPEQMPQDKSVSFNAKYYACERLSGDFYNVFRLDDNNIAIYLGDVSGHGVSAALLTVFANQNIISLKEKKDSPEIVQPGVVLENIYKSFNKTNINDEKYILMLYGIYNIKSKCFTYASAGVNVPPYIIKNSGEIIEMDAKGFPISKLGDYVMPFYDDRIIQLESGDKIIFYSDGLVEVQNINGDVYGQDKLKNFLEKNYKLNASELDNAIKNNLFYHVGQDGKLMDDATFLIMEVN